jgi:transcriptional regulator with XRE-family HTH domain
MDREITDPRLVLAARIERHRRARGWTTRQLAERAKVEQEEMDELLGGTGDVGVFTIVRVAGALGVATEELVTDPAPG